MNDSELQILGGKELIELVEQLQGELSALRKENAELRKENAELRAQLDELKRSKKRSAAPFSKGRPKANPKKPGRRKGKGDFKRREAPTVLPDDQVVELKAPLPDESRERCPQCGGALELGYEEATTIDLPKIIPREIKRWKIEVGQCQCGYRCRGTHPDLAITQHGATAHRVGPRVQSLGLALHYHYGLTIRKVPAVLHDICGIDLTQSSLTQAALKLGAAEGEVGQEAQRIKQAVQKANSVHTDDTGWRTKGKSSYLMVFASLKEKAVYYQIRSRHRAEEVAEVISETFEGVLCTDRFSSYDSRRFSDIEMQKCLSHILKNLSEVLEGKRGRARSFCQGLQRLLREGLELWHAYHRDEIGDETYEVAGQEIMNRLDHYLRERQLKDPDNQRMLTELGWHCDRGSLTKFLEDPEIEPTNNFAERMLRPAVIARKVSQCSKTEQGATTYAAFRTVLGTMALRKVPSIFRALVDLIAPLPVPQTAR